MMSDTASEVTIREVDVINWEQFYHKANEEIKPTEFIGGFYPRKHLSIIASKAGAGKTWYILKLISDLSRGGTIWLNQAFYEPKRKCVLFCGETNIELIKERFKAMYDRPDPENVIMLSYIEAAKHGIFFDLDTQEGVKNIMNACRDLNPDIVIFDTMMSFRRDDENSAQSTRDLMSRLHFLAESLNCAVIGTHHLRKKQGDKKGDKSIDQDEIIGSSALVRMAGTAFILSRGFECSRLECVKSWWEEPKKLLYQMKNNCGLIQFEMADEYNDFTEKRLRTEQYVKKILESPGAQLTAEAVMTACKVSRPVALEALEKFGTEVARVDKEIFFEGQQTHSELLSQIADTQ